MRLHKIGLLNLPLVFVPAALVLWLAQFPDALIFLASALAIIPLAGLMGKSTEMLAQRVGPGLGGLLNASFGNAAELIIAIVALQKGLTDVVKASITGSILGNVLLVLGASFLAGGLRYPRQQFNATAAGMTATLLALSAIGLLVPGLFHAHLVIHHQQGNEQDLSLEISVVLFATYLLLLLFSLKTHRHLYSGQVGGADKRSSQIHEPKSEWSVLASLAVLIASTVCIAVMSELLVGTIEAVSLQFGLTNMFVGVIVVAIIGNAAEHSTAVLAAMKNQMELAFQIAAGSALQVALFVAPLLVFLSYLPALARLDLVFTMMEVVAVAASVLILGLVAYDGESNWLEGLLLLAVYGILGIAFFHLPEEIHPKSSHAVLQSGSTCGSLPVSVFTTEPPYLSVEKRGQAPRKQESKTSRKSQGARSQSPLFNGLLRILGSKMFDDGLPRQQRVAVGGHVVNANDIC